MKLHLHCKHDKQDLIASQDLKIVYSVCIYCKLVIGVHSYDDIKTPVPYVTLLPTFEECFEVIGDDIFHKHIARRILSPDKFIPVQSAVDTQVIKEPKFFTSFAKEDYTEL